jgi:hypothetical protein
LRRQACGSVEAVPDWALVDLRAHSLWGRDIRRSYADLRSYADVMRPNVGRSVAPCATRARARARLHSEGNVAHASAACQAYDKIDTSGGRVAPHR